MQGSYSFLPPPPAKPATVFQEDPIVYTISVKNKEVMTLTGVEVTEQIPAGLNIDFAGIKYYTGASGTPVLISSLPGVSAEQVGNTLKFRIDRLTAGQTAYFVIPTTVKKNASNGANIVNIAKISKINDFGFEIGSNQTWHKVLGSAPTSLTVTNTISGNYSDSKRYFTYEIYLEDEDEKLPEFTELYYTGGIIQGSGAEAPDDGVLYLDGQGKAEFILYHGQSITFTDLQGAAKVRVTETDREDYTVTFTDSEIGTAEPGPDTTLRSADGADRVFDFVNDRSGLMPLGVFMPTSMTFLIAVAAILLLCITLAIRVRQKYYL
jgi:uncharacterized repeat protein (TIGR01451 family)